MSRFVAPQLTRQSSVAYLASFLARGSFVEASFVSRAVGALLEWAASYLDQQADATTMPAPPFTPGAKVCAGSYCIVCVDALRVCVLFSVR